MNNFPKLPTANIGVLGQTNLILSKEKIFWGKSFQDFKKIHTYGKVRKMIFCDTKKSINENYFFPDSSLLF